MNGIIRTEESWKDYYKDYSYNNQGLKTFNQMYNDIGLGEQYAIGTTTYDYGKAMIDAYKSAQEQSNAITSSNLGQGFKDREFNNIDEQLSEAYKSYEQNYSTAIGNIQNTFNEQRQRVNDILSDEASNAIKIQTSLRDYLRYLYSSSKNVENNMFDTDPWWNRLQVEDDEGKRILNDTELDNLMYDYEKDDNGNDIATLSMTGADIYKRLMYNQYFDDSSLLNYESWLANQSVNEKSDYYGLYDWYTSYNPYNVKYYDENGIPSNKSFIKTAFGMLSSDKAWEFAEKFGGFTEQELNDMYSKYASGIENITDTVYKYGKKDPDKVISGVSDMFNDLKSMAYQFGLEDDYKKFFDDVDNYINDVKGKVKDSGEMAGDWFKSFAIGLAGITGDVASGAMTGAVPTTTGKTLGAGAAMITAVANLILSASYATENVSEQRKENLKQSIEIKNAYNNLLAQFINESQYKRKQAEIDYYGYDKHPDRLSNPVNMVSEEENYMEKLLSSRKNGLSDLEIEQAISSLNGKTKDVYNPRNGGEKYAYIVVNGKQYVFSRNNSGSSGYYQNKTKSSPWILVENESKKNKIINDYFKD